VVGRLPEGEDLGTIGNGWNCKSPDFTTYKIISDTHEIMSSLIWWTGDQNNKHHLSLVGMAQISVSVRRWLS